MFRLQNVFKQYQGRTILHDINLELEFARTHVFLGASGRGKNTPLRFIVGGSMGEIRIDDEIARVVDPCPQELGTALRERGLGASKSRGFNNTCALAVRTETVRRFGLSGVSDLAGHEELRGGFTPDFLEDGDVFYRLQDVYGLHLRITWPMQQLEEMP